jgi:hypothetical protein
MNLQAHRPMSLMIIDITEYTTGMSGCQTKRGIGAHAILTKQEIHVKIND